MDGKTKKQNSFQKKSSPWSSRIFGHSSNEKKRNSVSVPSMSTSEHESAVQDEQEKSVSPKGGKNMEKGKKKFLLKRTRSKSLERNFPKKEKSLEKISEKTGNRTERSKKEKESEKSPEIPKMEKSLEKISEPKKEIPKMEKSLGKISETKKEIPEMFSSLPIGEDIEKSVSTQSTPSYEEDGGSGSDLPLIEKSEVPKIPNFEKSEGPKITNSEKSEGPKIPNIEKSEVPKIPNIEKSEVPKIPNIEKSEVPKLPNIENPENLEKPRTPKSSSRSTFHFPKRLRNSVTSPDLLTDIPKINVELTPPEETSHHRWNFVPKKEEKSVFPPHFFRNTRRNSDTTENSLEHYLQTEEDHNSRKGQVNHSLTQNSESQYRWEYATTGHSDWTKYEVSQERLEEAWALNGNTWKGQRVSSGISSIPRSIRKYIDHEKNREKSNNDENYQNDEKLSRRALSSTLTRRSHHGDYHVIQGHGQEGKLKRSKSVNLSHSRVPLGHVKKKSDLLEPITKLWRCRATKDKRYQHGQGSGSPTRGKQEQAHGLVLGHHHLGRLLHHTDQADSMTSKASKRLFPRKSAKYFRIYNFVPFKIQESDLLHTLMTWASSLWYLPPHFKKDLKIKTINRVFIPYWQLSEKLKISIFGHSGPESQNSGPKEEILEKKISVCVLASTLDSGESFCTLLKEQPERLLDVSNDILNVSSKKDIPNDFSYSLFPVTSLETNTWHAHEHHFGNLIHSHCKTHVQTKYPTNKVQVLKKDIEILEESREATVVYFPFYEGTYEVGEREFGFVINGTNGKVHGRRPLRVGVGLLFGPLVFFWWLLWIYLWGYEKQMEKMARKIK